MDPEMLTNACKYMLHSLIQPVGIVYLCFREKGDGERTMAAQSQGEGSVQ